MRSLQADEILKVVGGQSSGPTSGGQTTSTGGGTTTTTGSSSTTSFGVGVTFGANGNATGIRLSYSHSSGGSPSAPSGSTGGGGGAGGGGGGGIPNMPVVEINKPTSRTVDQSELADDLAGLY